LSWVLNWWSTTKGYPGGTTRFNRLQQFEAKGQCKNKWSRVSSTWSWQRTQLKDGRALFFLHRRLRVLSLSFNKSQKKTLCFFWTTTFQTRRKLGEPSYAQWDVYKPLLENSEGGPNVAPDVTFQGL
jgi:hypothetical protein